MAYTRDEMVYHDYYWGMAYEPGDPHITGEFDDTVLRRTAGKEMLYFVNHCADSWQWGGHLLKGFRRLEKIIRDMVPQQLKTQQEVKQWMDENINFCWSRMERQEAGLKL